MKAVCALVCLALAQGISASIFKRSHRPEDSLIVQPLDYINQYQQPLYEPQEQTYQDFIRTQKQQQQQKKFSKQQQKKQEHSSSGSSSHESSQESQQHISDDQQYVTLRSSGQKWSTPLFTAVMKVQNEVNEPTYGKSIVWSRDMQMAVPQKQKQKKKQQQDSTEESTLQLQQIDQIFAEAQQAMRHPTPEEKVQFHKAFDIAAAAHNEDDHLNATELLQKNNYPVEEHTIKTEDGYYLTLFRIPPKQIVRDVSKKPVVFLMHGLLGSADDWLLMGPKKSLAYLLADEGYDVWLGNARGNKYSRRHVTKHPALNDFWAFGNDEVALQDLPAMIDYVLETAQQEKMYYVGHSQGTTAFFALASERPEYNDKIIMMHALAPMVYMKNARSPLIRMIAPTSPVEAKLRHAIGHGQFRPDESLITVVGGGMLEKEIGCKNLSSNVNFVIAGVNIESLTPELTPVIVRHVPAGASSKMIKQYGQAVASDEFRRYDYGPGINRQVYGSVQPPRYRVERVRAPVTLHHSQEDWLAHPADVARLQQTLPNTTPANKVADEHFSHMDFQFSTKAPELVYQPLIESMNNNQSY